MFQELKFQLSTAILTILTLAAGVAAIVNFGQYEHLRMPDDGVIWVDRAGHVEALYVAPDGPAANWIQPGDRLNPVGPAIDCDPDDSYTGCRCCGHRQLWTVRTSSHARRRSDLGGPGRPCEDV